MNTRKFFERIDRKVAEPTFDRLTFCDWVEDEIETELGRPLVLDERRIICVAYYAGAMRIGHQNRERVEGRAHV